MSNYMLDNLDSQELKELKMYCYGKRSAYVAIQDYLINRKVISISTLLLRYLQRHIRQINREISNISEVQNLKIND